MSERLTIRDENGEAYVPLENHKPPYPLVTDDAVEKLARYEDLEEAGRLEELPCKIGDTVYSFSFNIVYPFTVNGFEINKDGVELKGSYCGEEKSLEYWSIRFPVSKIGKAVFLTKEEAEATLKGAENDTGTND